MSLANEAEDIRFNQRDMMKLGILPSESGKQDIFELLELQKTRPRDKRPELVDPLELLRPRKR